LQELEIFEHEIGVIILLCYVNWNPNSKKFLNHFSHIAREAPVAISASPVIYARYYKIYFLSASVFNVSLQLYQICILSLGHPATSGKADTATTQLSLVTLDVVAAFPG
jgi:hypothetical protein